MQQGCLNKKKENQMNSNKLVEAFVTANSTPLMQMETFLRNINNPEKFLVDLSVLVFRLPRKNRTFPELEKELTALFMKKLGLWEMLKAMVSGLIDPAGPIEGIQKTIITRACCKMGLNLPVN
jgi:hypothetical protein